MFDIGLLEMLLVSVVALVILGPQRFPIAMRAVVLWVTRLRTGVEAVKTELQQELGLDDLGLDNLGLEEFGIEEFGIEEFGIEEFGQEINAEQLMQPIQQIQDAVNKPVLDSPPRASASNVV